MGSAADARPSQVITECALRDTRSSITSEAQLRSGEGSRAFHPHSVLNRGNTTTSREKRGTRAGTTNWKPCANNYKKKEQQMPSSKGSQKDQPTWKWTRAWERNHNKHANKKKQSVTRNASPWAKSSPTRNGSLNGQRNSNSQEAKAFKAALTPLSWKWQAYNKKNSAPRRRGSRCNEPTRQQKQQKKPWRQREGLKSACKSRQTDLPKNKTRAGQRKPRLNRPTTKPKWLLQQPRLGTQQPVRQWS